jgi:hypothetical protein
MAVMGRGFALALAMLIGALSVTSVLALGLQGHATRQPAAADFSPTQDAIVDPSGWPREVQGRSRLPAASESGSS